MSLRRVRLALWLLVVIAAMAAAWIALRPAAPIPATKQTVLAEIGGPFTLTGGDGKPFSSSRLAGRPHAIFFGFTHCPDVCPTTLSRLAKLRRQLGQGDGAFDIVFVTVDPQRDGPAEVAAYSRLLGTPVIGLTGSPAAIKQVTKQYGVFAAKVAQPGGDYSMDHSATVLLFDAKGRFEATIAPDEQDSAALAKLKRIVA